MTGPEHYREAQRLIELSRGQELDGVAQYTVAAAQVHATLALAAATALGCHGEMYVADRRAWDQAASAAADGAS